MKEHVTETLLADLCFGEGPRWHDGKLWFSDMHDHVVRTVDEAGNTEVVTTVDNRPSGLGWDRDGRLLIVSMVDRRLLRLEDDGSQREVADLSSLATWHCNDMVVDAQGRAYVGNFGFDLDSRATPTPSVLIRVDPDGSTRVVADELMFPNGTVITPDGSTLIVGESFGARLTAFEVDGDGALSKRRTWATLEGAAPDGICLDEQGQIWVASPTSAEVLRVAEGGEVSERVDISGQAYACMLGGSDGRTLFICTASTSDPEECREQRGARIETVRVDVPRDGLP